MADDLVASVALDAFGASVPAADPALQIKHVECVVGDALHEQAELLLALAQMLFGLSPFGKVLGDLCVAYEVALSVPDHVDHHVRPEACAVLAHAPALVFEPTSVASCPERRCRQIECLVLIGVEPREMLSDDLVFPVAFEPLRPAVPARHSAFRIQQVDRVVANPLDQEPVTAFGGLSLFEALVFFQSSGSNSRGARMRRLATARRVARLVAVAAASPN